MCVSASVRVMRCAPSVCCLCPSVSLSSLLAGRPTNERLPAGVGRYMTTTEGCLRRWEEELKRRKGGKGRGAGPTVPNDVHVAYLSAHGTAARYRRSTGRRAPFSRPPACRTPCLVALPVPCGACIGWMDGPDSGARWCRVSVGEIWFLGAGRSSWSWAELSLRASSSSLAFSWSCPCLGRRGKDQAAETKQDGTLASGTTLVIPQQGAKAKAKAKAKANSKVVKLRCSHEGKGNQHEQGAAGGSSERAKRRADAETTHTQSCVSGGVRESRRDEDGRNRAKSNEERKSNDGAYVRTYGTYLARPAGKTV